MSVQIIELGCFVEIKIPNKKLPKFKSLESYYRYAYRYVDKFLAQLKTFNGNDIYHAECFKHNRMEEIDEIPDLNYSKTNQVPQDKEHRTFRIYLVTLYSIVPVDIPEQRKSLPEGIIFDYQDMKVNLINCMYSEWKNRNLDAQ